MRTFLLVSVLLAAPAGAAPAPLAIDKAAWRDDKGALPRPKDADIGVPREAGGLTLHTLAAIRPGGNDNVAQYRSADGAVIGTLYLYRPGLPDPTLTAIATTEALSGMYGKRPTAVERAPAGGVADSAYRVVFDAIELPPSRGFAAGPNTSVAAFFQAGAWLVKLRVTGPAARRAEVIAAADALLAGVRFSGTEKPTAVAPYELSDCPAAPDAAPAVARPRDAQTPEDALAIAVGSSVVAMTTDPDGVRRLCTMYRDTRAGIRLVLSATGGQGASYMLLGDSGNIVRLAVLPSRTGAGGVALSASSLGRTDNFGPFDRMPNADQLIGISEGRSEWLGPPLSAFHYQGRKFNVSVFAEKPK